MTRFLPWFIAWIAVLTAASAWATASQVGTENATLRTEARQLSTDLSQTRVDYARLVQQDECKADPYVCMIEQGGV